MGLERILYLRVCLNQFACLQTVCLPAGSFDFLLKKKK